MAEALAELTRNGVILGDTDLSDHVADLFEIAMDRREEWDPPKPGIVRNSFFRSPVFRFPRPSSLHRTRLMISPANGLHGPGMYTERPPSLRATGLWVTGLSRVHPHYLYELEYGIKLHSASTDYPFSIRRAYLNNDTDLKAWYTPELDPENFVLEGDPERLVVQGIIGAALNRFALPKAAVVEQSS